MLPLYLKNKNKIRKTKEILLSILENCTLCPRNCRVNRLENKKGFCKTGRFAIVSSYFLHFGEEPELVGRTGSGTIFFSNCNLGCIYCQNYTISHLGEGEEVDSFELAKIMLKLQKLKAENINFVTPTHIIPQIVEALELAIEEGLNIPLVYNCGGYEKKETIALLDGIIDIYMPDIKYADNNIAKKFSFADDYFEIVKEAVLEMHRQVGDLIIEDGIAKRGLLIRHLVLPNRLASSFSVLDFVRSISKDTYINIMDQYHPCFKAYEFKELSRRITDKEYLEVLEYAKSIGLHKGFLL